MTFLNTAVSGKRTLWMIGQLNLHKKKGWDYCFIYGGANDAASMVSPETAFRNIQKMVDTCNQYGIKPIVITGTDQMLRLQEKPPNGKTMYGKRQNFKNI